MIKRKLDDKSWLYFDNRGSLTTLEWGQGVITFFCRGLQLAAFAPLVISHGEQQLKRAGRCIYMVDALESNQMETGFREQMTVWLRDHPENVEAHLLIRSKLIQMAVNVTNLVLGKATTKAYSDTKEWEEAARAHAPQFRRRVLTLPPDLLERPAG